MFKRVVVCLLAGLISGAGVSSAQASGASAAPSGRVILEVQGTGVDRVFRFDRAALERLPQKTLKTHTDWTDGEQVFEGVLLKDLLDHLGAKGTEVRAVALNDYAVSIPAADADAYPVLLALKQNGRPMRIRDKGPIWIVYPNDVTDKSRPGAHNDKMVWQLQRLEIR